MTSNDLVGLSPEEITKFPSKDLPVLVGAAIELDRNVKALGKVLDLAKGRLIEEAEREYNKEAEQHKLDGKEFSQTGTSWTFSSMDGQSARVSFPNPKLLSSFWIFNGEAMARDGKKVVKLGNIEEACKDAEGDSQFKKLFAQHWKPAKAFRELIIAILPKPAQRKLLKMMERPNSPRVTFSTGPAEEDEE